MAGLELESRPPGCQVVIMSTTLPAVPRKALSALGSGSRHLISTLMGRFSVGSATEGMEHKENLSLFHRMQIALGVLARGFGPGDLGRGDTYNG